MAVARSRKQVTTYVPKCDRELPPERQTRFRLRPLNVEQLANIESTSFEYSTEGKAVRALVGTQTVLLVRAGLAGWDNFADENGAQVEFKADAGKHRLHGIDIEEPASIESIEWLGVDLARELAGEVYAMNKVNRDDVGN